MTLGAQIFKLVESLSAQEKAFVTKEIKDVRKIGTKYLKLFELYKKSDEYDSDSFGLKVKRLGFNQESAANGQLYQIILDTLIKFNRKSLPEYEVFQKLLASKLLLNRGFSEASLKELDSAEKINEKAGGTEIFPYIYLRKNYYAPYDPQYVDYKMKAISNAKEKMAVLQDVVYYEEINVPLIPVVINIGTVCKTEEERNSIQSVLESSAFNEHIPSSRFGHMMKQHLTCFYSYLLNDVERAYKAALAAINLYEDESYEEMDQGSLQNLSIFHYNAIQYSFTHLDRELFDKHFTEIEKISIYINTASYKKRIEGEMKFLELNWAFSTKEFKKAEEIADKLSANIDELFQYNQSVYNEVIMKIVLSLFHANRFNDTLTHLSSFKQTASANLLPEEHTVLSIIEIFVHIKLENFDYSQSIVRSLYRRLKKENKLFEFERLVMSFIKDWFKVGSSKNERTALKQKYYARVDILTLNSTENLFLNLIDLKSWINEIG